MKRTNTTVRRIKGHSISKVRDQLPTISQSTGKTGIAKLGGNMGRSFPSISGFNAAGKTATPY